MISNGSCDAAGCYREDQGRGDGLCRKHSNRQRAGRRVGRVPARNLANLRCDHGYCDCRRTDHYIGRHNHALVET